MLISPPFLIDSIEISETLDAGLQPVAARDATTMAPEGNYPVSQYLMWHTGVHLQAPKTGDADYAPVRAVADGIVMFINPPRDRINDAADGQAYNPFGAAASWTDNGMVVIEHTTEIGVDGDNATDVKFFSGYMHLSKIDTSLAVGNKVYRKNILGKPGAIYDHAGQTELSISCDTDNLKRLIGRKPEWQEAGTAPAGDGRTDAVFGNVYIYLPSTTPISQGNAMPHAHLRSGYHGTQNLGEAQWVEISYVSGGDANGDCVLTSYSATGAKIGAAPAEAGFEYRLCKESSGRHASASSSGAPDSSPSGWYELLRFGRNLGRSATDKDALPVNAMHWRKIKTVAGTIVWADLNAEGSYKFSDADFLPVMGWHCYHDDGDVSDQRCSSDKLKGLFTDPNDPESKGDSDKLAKRIGNPDVFYKLAYTICKFPNEWDKSTLETRYKFMSERPEMKENPDNWSKAKKHLESMGLDGLPDGFKNADWHFHPAAFIRHFTKCGWLSAFELAQCFPRKYLKLEGTTFASHDCRWATAFPTARRWSTSFNKATRKYGIAAARRRLVHFFAHAIPETEFLTLMKEGDNSSHTYLTTRPYYPYYGRGLIQLTWKDTYKDYGEFRKFPRTNPTGNFQAIGWDPDVLIASGNTNYHAINCADSACWFVNHKPKMLASVDHGISQSDAITVSRFVNGNVDIENLNGLEIRVQSLMFLRDTLLNTPADASTEAISLSWRRKSQPEPTGQLNAQGQMKMRFFLKEPPWQLQVPLNKQRP